MDFKYNQYHFVPTLVYGIGPWNGLGLMGAAIATNIGRSAGVIYQLYYLFSGVQYYFFRYQKILSRFFRN